MILRTLAAAALAGTVATSAMAQTTLLNIADNVIVEPFGIAAGLLDDIDIYTPAGVEIGDVERVIGSDAQTATHLVVDFDDDGGFPDRDDVIVPLDAFTLDANRLVTELTPEEVLSLPTAN